MVGDRLRGRRQQQPEHHHHAHASDQHRPRAGSPPLASHHEDHEDRSRDQSRCQECRVHRECTAHRCTGDCGPEERPPRAVRSKSVHGGEKPDHQGEGLKGFSQEGALEQQLHRKDRKQAGSGDRPSGPRHDQQGPIEDQRGRHPKHGLEPEHRRRRTSPQGADGPEPPHRRIVRHAGCPRAIDDVTP